MTTTFKTKDGVSIFYKDWGSGQPIVFSHGWPLNSDAWEDQMLFLAENGYRVIAHDRRGHGKSEQSWNGNDMDTYADDLGQLIEHLDLKDAILVGHSTGGGEVAHYLGRHGTKRAAGAVLIGAVTPGMVKSANNPDGVPMDVFDGIRDGVRKDRAQYFKDFTIPFFGANRDGAKVSEGLRNTFVTLGMQASLKAIIDCVAAFSETDFTEDLKKIDVPVLIIHGDDDQIVPIDITAKRAVKLAPKAELKIYKGGSHALPATEKDKVSKNILEFARNLAR
jgi:non-heme chloroperoxidase